MSESKICSKCKTNKSVSEFHKNKTTTDGLNKWCKTCKSERRKWKYQNDDGAERIRNLNRNRLSRYGITPERYDEMLRNQSNKCFICEADKSENRNGSNIQRLGVDHDHITGKIRALLCRSCNLVLGYSNDDPDRLRKAADYIERFK